MSLGAHTLAPWKILMGDSHDAQMKVSYPRVPMPCNQVIVRFIMLRCCYATAQHYNPKVIMLNTSPQTVRLNVLAENVSNCV